MKKVLVIGCPGAGKSTFSTKLAAKTGLPLIHLDFYFHDKNFNYEYDRQAWRARVLELVDGKQWIVDGNYSSTFPERFKAADSIIFFDYPLYLRLWGVLKRRWVFRKAKRPDMPDDWQEHFNRGFLMFVITFRKNYYNKITDVLDSDTSKKVTIFKNRRDTRNYLDSLKASIK